MTSKAIKRNTNALRTILRANQNRVSNATNTKIKNIIELYEDRKISQFTTALNTITRLTTARGKTERDKAKAEYEKVAEKHQDRKPLNERMKVSRKENVERKRRETKKEYSLEVFFYSATRPADSVRKPAFKSRNGTPLYIMFLYPMIFSVKTPKTIEDEVGKRIIAQDDRELFKKIRRILSEDEKAEDFYNSYDGYIDAVKIVSATNIEESEEQFEQKRKKLRNAQQIGINHRYIQTELDAHFETLKEAIRVNDYIENECWINTLVDFDLIKNKRRRKFTRESILLTLGMTDEEFKEKGASIEEMAVVFEKYRISARIFNFMEELIFEYDPPEGRDHNLRCFYALVKGDHIYTINRNLQQMKANMGIRKEQEIRLRASTDYYLDKRDEHVECHMIYSINDLLKYTEKNEYTMVYSKNNLAELFYQSKMAGYEPTIKFSGATISELNFCFRVKMGKKKQEIKYKVKTQNLIPCSTDGWGQVEREEVYNNMSKAMYEFNKGLFNPLHKSYYNEVDMKVMKDSRAIPPIGRLCSPSSDAKLAEIDIRKAYTHALNQVVEIPKFTEFDVWKPYDYNAEYDLSPLTLYYVRAEGGEMFFNKPYCLIYGKFLNEFFDKCEVLYYKEPSFKYEVDYKKLVDDLWKTDISLDEAEDTRIKKLISNVNIGLLEKSTNTSQKSLVFNELNEALYHRHKFGKGKINRICGIYDDEDKMTREMKNKYFTLTLSDKQDLCNGFIYIKELILQHHNFRMYQDYQEICDKGLKVISVKTDAFVLGVDEVEHLKKEKHHRWKQNRPLNFSGGIGRWRHQDKDIILPIVKYEMKPNELVDIPIYQNEKLKIKDEYDTEAICQNIIGCSPCLIKAKLAGSGKSYIGTYFQRLGYNVLFVCPNNKQIQEVEVEATTLNKFFSIAVEAGDRLPVYNHSGFDVIVFDELGMANGFILNKVRKFVNEHSKDKIIIGTADGKQLPPINDLTNTKDHEKYLNECLNQIFYYKIYLKISKRLKTEEDRIKLNEIYDDIWKHRLPIKEIVYKHFQLTNDIMESEHNIAYTNMCCKKVSETIRHRLGKKYRYEIGEHMICREYKKDDNGNTFNVNFTYEILNVNLHTVELQNIKTKTTHITTIKILEKHFRYAYCATCHSSQGASVDKSITIFEWDKSHLVSREWFYTALTRSTDINKVKFYKSDDDFLSEENLIKYFKNKIQNYRLQDLRGNREINEDKYINVQWLMDRINSRCSRCSRHFEFSIEHGMLCSNLTAQRLDNAQQHSKENCEAMCHYCNCSSK